jgi:hypothetical protein
VSAKKPGKPSPASGAPHGEQTNRLNGEAVILGLQGKPYGLVGLDEGGSPNHKVGEASAWLIQKGLVQKDYASAALGVKRLQMLVDGPFMSIEPATDSHDAIWLREMAGARIGVARLRDKVAGAAALERSILKWFEHRYSLLMLGWVPSGPLEGTCVLPCARKSFGSPGSGIRSAWLQLIRNGKVTEKGVSPRALVLDIDKPDNAGLAFTKMILSDPALGFGDIKGGELPELIAPLIVTRYEDGHEGRFPDGIPGQHDAAPYLWIRYSTGECKWDGTPAPDLGPMVWKVALPSMA